MKGVSHFSFQVHPCQKTTFCHSALCRNLADPLGCGRKTSWLPGAAVPLRPVQHTRVSCRCLRWTRSDSFCWEQCLGQRGRNRRGLVPLWGRGAACTPSLLEVSRPSAGWLAAERACLHWDTATTALLHLRYRPEELWFVAWTKHPSKAGDKCNPSAANTALLHVAGQSLRRHRVKAMVHPPWCTSCSQVFAGRSLHNPGLHLREGFCYLDCGCHSPMVQKSTGGKVWQF